MLNLISAFIFARKSGKTAKIAVEVAKDAIWGTFWTNPLVPHPKAGKVGV